MMQKAAETASQVFVCCVSAGFVQRNATKKDPMHKNYRLLIQITLLLLGLTGGLAGRLYAQSGGIVLDPNYAPDVLVRDIFASGACETITNIASIGNRKGIGYFENASHIIGLDRGIILSTGEVERAAGPNNAADISGDLSDNSGDSDLNALATAVVRDDVGLEFDFVPLDSFVTFRYVFASDEYCEFVGSVYNDVFGFFIRGPGISGGFTGGAANVALIPGSEAFVAINSVNHQSNSNFFVRNDRPQDALACNIAAQNSSRLQLIEYDGFTTVLTAVLKLQPCQTYHIRLVVGDVGDQFFDSAVFLEAGSFNLGGSVDVQAFWPSDSPGGLTEGCNDGYFRFSRQSENLSFPLTVGITLLPSSTATPGIDFAALPAGITIPAGRSFIDLPVSSFRDAEIEGPERLAIELAIPCACYADSAALMIVEPPPINLSLPDVWLCPGGQNQLAAQINGGRPPYQFQWSTGATSPAITVTAQGPAVYSLTITDACGYRDTASCSRQFSEPPTAQLSGEAEVCYGDTAYLRVALTGAPPWQLVYAIDGLQQPPIGGIQQADYALPAHRAGAYTLVQVTDAACSAPGSGYGSLAVQTIEAIAEITDASCHDRSDGAIAATLSGGTPPYRIRWEDDVPDSLMRTGLAPGLHTIYITDAQDCRRAFSWPIGAPPPLQAPGIDCRDLLNGILSFEASGGTPPYRYAIDGGQWQTAEWWAPLAAAETYDLHIADARNCQIQAEWLMPAAYPLGMAALPELLPLALGEQYALTPEWHIPEALIDSLWWTPDLGLACLDCPGPLLTATAAAEYQLIITDLFGCTDTAFTRVKVDDRVEAFIPNAFSPNGDNNNDWLHIFANPAQVAEIELFQVFDRWGGHLFEGRHWPINSTRHGWDGAARGKPLDAGVYVYLVRFRLVNGSVKIVKGEVMLMR